MHIPDEVWETGKTSVEGATYATERVKEKVLNSKIPDDQKAQWCEKADEYQELVEFTMNSDAQSWSGQDREPIDFKNMQKNIAKKEANTLNGQVEGTVRWDIAINEQSQILRRITVDGQPIDPKPEKSMDRLFNAWLAEEQDIICKSGTLHQATSNGEIKYDEKGEPVIADPQVVKESLDELSDYVMDKKIEGVVGVIVQQQEFPGRKEGDTHVKATEQVVQEEVVLDNEAKKTI